MSPAPTTPTTPRKTAIIIIIGNEILDGYTMDTNSHYLSEVLREYGVNCQARHTIRDNREEIKRFLWFSLEDKSDYLFLCGGLGPTHDDLTFEAVAEALQKKLVLSKEAIHNIQERLDFINHILPEEKKIHFNEASRKMALIPEGTTVLSNKAGTAPALSLHLGSTCLFLLPGVPHELKWIMENEILGAFITKDKQDHVVEIPVKRGESNFAQVLQEMQKTHPWVKIGSYPQPGRVVIRVVGEEEDVEAVRKEIQEHILAKLSLDSETSGMKRS